ncbi:hypothetical protein IYW40_11640 [Methylocystis sp. H4A]|uniref:hypothetical protein n=1 Tax=Methylocystis sp. H4A TaxID=2785788 RepID=UPI0018C1F927|nr:hypothetical protein [Methylocystis sp. H4A]MBG0802126.1 hypothetical protein [Methylocystis sp. H4A]
MEIKDLRGRLIEDIPYTGLIESLCKITLICHTAGEAKNDLTKDDLLSFISQIAVIGTEASILAGATEAELSYVSKYLLEGMHLDRERPH